MDSKNNCRSCGYFKKESGNKNKNTDYGICSFLSLDYSTGCIFSKRSSNPRKNNKNVFKQRIYGMQSFDIGGLTLSFDASRIKTRIDMEVDGDFYCAAFKLL